MKATDSFEHQLRTLAKSLREDLLTLSEEDRRECQLCGIEELDIDLLPSQSRVEFYRVPCLEQHCGGSMSVVRFVVETPDEIETNKEKLEGWRCSSVGCEPSESLILDAIHGYEPHTVEEYHIPTTYLVKTPIYQHHISYDPERTILVCSTCHGRIHADNGIYNDLIPDLSRKEAEEMGIDARN